jgi:YesN/AraC family two-component response regulator
MVVDDVQDFVDTVEVTLSVDMHIEVVATANTGEEALKVFPKASPDLVLLDFRLPGINGLETAKRMKEQRPNVKIVLLTAYAKEVKELAAEIMNIEEVISKSSFSRARIRHLLKKV